MRINDDDPENGSYLEIMQMQYDNNNLAGYLSFKKFYDYMADGRN